MKHRIVLALLALLLCLGITGCAQKLENAEAQDLELSYALENGKNEYHRGEEIKIHGNITNVSDKTYKYIGVGKVTVGVSVYCELDGEKYYLTDRGVLLTDAAPWDCKLLSGQMSGCTNDFKVQSDAPLGSYHIRVYYKDFEQIFENVLTIVE